MRVEFLKDSHTRGKEVSVPFFFLQVTQALTSLQRLIDGPNLLHAKIQPDNKMALSPAGVLSQIVIVGAAAVSRSVQPPAGGMQVGSRGGSGGCSQPGEGLLGQVGVRQIFAVLPDDSSLLHLLR